MYEDLSSNAKNLLKIIPKETSRSIWQIGEMAQRWFQMSKQDVERAVDELLQKGYIFEPIAGEYQQIKIKAEYKASEGNKPEKLEEKLDQNPEKTRKYLDFQGKLRVTKSGNIELTLYLPANYLKKMLGGQKNEI